MRNQWIILAFAAVIFLGCAVSPPHLFDDFDATQAQIASNMHDSGDWVTPRLAGVVDFEKPPLVYWLMAGSYSVFGVHDWAARLPLALVIMLLCWMTYCFGAWAFGEDAGLHSGLALTTCIGLFLFSRVLIPDATVLCCISGALFAAFRAMESPMPVRKWPALFGLALGLGLLTKGLIAAVFPLAAIILFMLLSRQLYRGGCWRRLGLPIAIPVALLVFAPWAALATIRNPPYFDFTLHAGPGEYHGFFWFFFINEHVLRFLHRRYPQDYGEVPRLFFWLLTLVWLFPWTPYLAASIRQTFRPSGLAERTRLYLLCWFAVVMVFFTLSTRQEYYSMPMYPALALLIGSVAVSGDRWIIWGNRALAAVFVLIFVTLIGILYLVRGMPAEGSIANAMSNNPELYTLSLGHMSDLSIAAFAYLRVPLVMAAAAMLAGCCILLTWRNRNTVPSIGLAVIMAVFFHAARVAMLQFDSYLGSYPIAQALEHVPSGKLIEAGAYFEYSSVYFYADRSALYWNGRKNNLEYGSYAPGAPDIFIDDTRFTSLWNSKERYYLIADAQDLPRVKLLVGEETVHLVLKNANSILMCNQTTP